MPIVRWLHISDLHHGFDDFTVNEFRRTLPTFLRSLADENEEPINYAFVTGDLRYAKSKNEPMVDYNAASDFINDICDDKCLGIPSSRIFIVPGNHDVDISPESMRMVSIQKVRSTYNSINAKINENDLVFLKPRNEFLCAYNNITGREFDINHWLYTDEFVRILLIDTTITCTKSSLDFGALIVGLENLQSLLKDSQDSKPLLVLAHHSVDWFESRERKKLCNLLIDYNASAYLCGHIHSDINVSVYPFSREGSLNQFCAPTVMDNDESGQQSTIMGFYIGEIDTDVMEGFVTLYKWDTDENKFYMRETHSLNRRKSKSEKKKALIELLELHLEKTRKKSGSYILGEICRKLFPDLKDEIGLSYSTDENEDIPLLTCLNRIWHNEKNHNLLLTGEGGIGKTVSLLEVCDCLLYDGKPTFYVPLHDIQESNIQKYIEHSILMNNPSFILLFNRLVHDTSPAGPQVILLLDGFNEVAERHKIDLLADIERWWNNYPSVQIVITSRYDMRLYFPILIGVNHLEVQLLRDTQVKEYLSLHHIPIPEPSIIKTLEFPLMLTLYVSAEGYFIKNRKLRAIQWRKQITGAGTIIWNFLQTQIQKSVFDTNKIKDILNYIVIVEYVIPYIGWKMESIEQFSIKKNDLISLLNESIDFFKNKWSGIKSAPIRIIEIVNDYECDCHWNIEAVFKIVTQELHIMVLTVENVANFIHQQFRDCFSSIFLLSEICYENLFETPTSWKSCINPYVNTFLLSFVEKKNLDTIWESLRNKQMENDNFIIYNIYKLYSSILENNFSKIDFTGQDLRTISLISSKFVTNDSHACFQNSIIGNHSLFREGHSGSINCLEYIRNKKLLISGSDDCIIRAWNVYSEACLFTLEGHLKPVKYIEWIPDKLQLVSYSEDLSVIIWDLEHVKIAHQFIIGPANSFAVMMNGKYLVSNSWDNSIYVWEIESGTCRFILEGHSETVSCLASLNEGKQLISCSKDGYLRLWDIDNGKCLFAMKEHHQEKVNDVICLPDG